MRRIALALAPLLFAPGYATAETWRIGLEEVAGSVQHEYAQAFARRIEARTDGEIEVRVHPYGRLGGMPDIYYAVQSGAIQMSFGSGFLGGVVPESQLFSLNYVLSDDEWVNARALNADAFLDSEAFVGAFSEHNLHPLSVVIEGWQVWTANRAINTPEDMQGLAIRTMDNRLLKETYRAYGASPVTIEYGELYSALQLGQAEGNIQPVFAHQEMGFYEVQDYMVFARQAAFIATFMANQDWYEGLSAERRRTIETVTDELVRVIHDHQKTLNNERLEAIRADSDIGIIELTPEQRERFRERSMRVRETFVEMVGERGRKLLNTLTEQVERFEAAQEG